LEELVQFERQCCSTLSWSIEKSRVKGRLFLTVTGLHPDSPFFNSSDEEQISDFNNSARSKITRLIAASGVGIIGSLFVCCLLPIAVAVVASATIAAAFMQLDSPAFMVVTAGFIGVGMWYWLSRKVIDNCYPASIQANSDEGS